MNFKITLVTIEEIHDNIIDMIIEYGIDRERRR